MSLKSEYFAAVKKGNVTQVACLLEKLGIGKIDIKDESNGTALMYAVSNNHTELVYWLLQHGADPTAYDEEGYNVIWCAQENDSNNEIRLAIVTAIAKIDKHILPQETPTKKHLIAALELQLLHQIDLSKSAYPFYNSVCRHLRNLIITLDPNYFETKLLDGAQKNNEKKIIQMLQCGADVDRLHSHYRQILNNIINDEQKISGRKEAKGEYKESKSLAKEKSYSSTFLGELQRIVTIAEQFLQRHYKNKDEETIRKFIGNSLIYAKKLLTEYQYKNTSEYKTNSAILFLTLLTLESKQVERINIESNAPVIRDKGTKTDLSMQEIGKKIIQTIQGETKISERTIAFIALGITKSGSVVATTNYHAPRVFLLADLLDPERYKNATALYEKHMRKMGPGILRNSKGKIHAETMLAALSDTLEINQILIVDQGGLKKQNCLCCASYLCQKGFSNEPHFEKIKNFVVPRNNQIAAVTMVLQEQIKSDLCFEFIGTKQAKMEQKSDHTQQKILSMLPAAEQESVLVGSNPLQIIFDFILRYHPTKSSTSQKEGITSMFGETAKLSCSAMRFFEREKVIKKAIKKIPKFNLCLELKKDGRIEREDSTHLKEDPDSPRSHLLAKLGNKWLKNGETSRVTEDFINNTFVLSRALRT